VGTLVVRLNVGLGKVPAVGPSLLSRTGLMSFYFRVLEEGEVRADDKISLVERPQVAVSVAEANRAMRRDRHDLEGIERLLAVPELSASWRRTFGKRLDGRWEDASLQLEGSSNG